MTDDRFFSVVRCLPSAISFHSQEYLFYCDYCEYFLTRALRTIVNNKVSGGAGLVRHTIRCTAGSSLCFQYAKQYR
jgi:hypothetical protein